MPNFDKDPGGYNMKPSGFKMKNPTLSAGRKGAPIQANYGGGESPAKFLGGILRGVNSITRVVDKGARGVRRKVRKTVGKVAKRVGLGGIAGKLGVGRKRGQATKAGKSQMKNAISASMLGLGGRGKFGKGLVKNKSVKKNPTRGLTHKSTIKVGNRPIGRPNLSGKGGFGVGAAAASIFGSSRPKRGQYSHGPGSGAPPRRRPATGSQASRANKRRALFSGGLFGKR